jgi:hypothetical protein
LSTELQARDDAPLDVPGVGGVVEFVDRALLLPGLVSATSVL